jgi:isopenicillin N synthase-like dioxygenase
VGPHKDSSGWLTFLYQVGAETGLEVLSNDGEMWIPAPPVLGTFVVNFGNAFEAATDGGVRATVHRVLAPRVKERYSIPFFMGLPLDLTVSEVRELMPESVKAMRRERDGEEAVEKTAVSSFLDPRWDSLGESQLRKWIRSHEDVGRRWYGDDVVSYYLS